MARKAEAKIDVNTAGRDELAEVPGIGPNIADAVIRLREERGGFKSVDELEEVTGIGAQNLETMRAHLSAEAAAETAEKGARAARRPEKQSSGTAAEVGQRGVEEAVEAAKSTAEAAKEVGTAQAEAVETARRSVEGGVGAAIGRQKQGVEAAVASSGTMLEALRDANVAWLGFLQDQTRANLQTVQRLAQCRSAGELIEVQTEHVRASIERLTEEQARLTDLATRMTTGTLRPFAAIR